jgi:hypothetical protein
VATGSGIGMAWPHLYGLGDGRVTDPAEGPVAAAAINTVQRLRRLRAGGAVSS